MVAYTQVVVFLSSLISLVGATQNGAFLHQRSAGRSFNTAGARFGFSYSMNEPVAQTLLTLDTDRNGRIEPNEIAAFARNQGMDAAAATQEFSSIDTNGDGVLDSAELGRALGTPDTPAAAAPVAPVIAQRQEQEPMMPAFADPIIDMDSLGSSNTPSPAFVSAMNSYSQNTAATPQLVTSQEAPTNSQFAASSVVQQTSNLVDSANILNDNSRQSALAAAQHVSEQLQLEESEEKQARDFDRQAADMRSKSMSLAKQTVQEALDAGAKAANENVANLLTKVTELEEQAERAEVKAAALSAKSKMEVEEANSFMAVANKAMQMNPALHV
jgi:hypothetical protein